MSNRKKIAIGALAEMYGRKLTEASVNLFVMASGDLTDAQFERAAGLVAQRSKFMPTPAELIECSKTGGVSYEAKAELAFEELDRALAENKPSLLSPLVTSVCRQLGGFQHLHAIPLEEFRTWKRKEFLSSYVTLAKENPERLQAIAGPQSQLAIDLGSKLRTIPSREETAEQEAANRKKLMDLTDQPSTQGNPSKE